MAHVWLEARAWIERLNTDAQRRGWTSGQERIKFEWTRFDDSPLTTFDMPSFFFAFPFSAFTRFFPQLISQISRDRSDRHVQQFNSRLINYFPAPNSSPCFDGQVPVGWSWRMSTAPSEQSMFGQWCRRGRLCDIPRFLGSTNPRLSPPGLWSHCLQDYSHYVGFS